MTRRWLALPLACAAVTLASEGRADDDVVVGSLVVSAFAAAGVDIAFTVHDGLRIGANEEPDSGWMLAQSSVVGPQALFLDVVTGVFTGLDEREEGYVMAVLPAAIWSSSLATFSTWTLASSRVEPPPFGRTRAIEDDTKPRDRFAVSWVIGTNLAFSSTALGSAVVGRWSPLYVSVPQSVLMGTECGLAAVHAGLSDKARPGWIALSVWSGVLTAHGVASMLGRSLGGDDSRPVVGALPLTIAPAPIEGLRGPAPGVVAFASF